jgi:undecaprenyl-diphosphatase
MVVLWVLIVAFVASAVAGTVSMSRHMRMDPIDPAAEERWIVARLARFPRLAHLARRRLDRETAGGLLLTIAFVVTFVTALLFGTVLDMVNEDEGLAEWDASVSEWGSENASSAAVDVLKFVTDFGGTTYLAVLMTAVGIYDYWRHRRRDVFLFLLVVVVGEIILTNSLKAIVDRDRPSVLRLTGASGPSFPSGHSAAAASCWAAMALVVTRTAGRRARATAAGVAAFIAGAVATSRALLGVHWLTDVVAGLILGWGWFTLVAIAFGGRLLRLGEPAERVEATVSAGPGRHPAATT